MNDKELHRLSRIRDESLERLKELEGKYWKEVQGEFHADYKEFPTWILLFEDSDIEESHNEFKKVVSEYFNKIGDANFTVSYRLIKNNKDILLDFLNGNNEISQGHGPLGKLAAMPEERPLQEASIFEARDSERS